MSRLRRLLLRRTASTEHADPGLRRAGRWRDSGLVDLPFYAALRGRAFASPLDAARDFVDHGMAERLTTHPLLDFHSLPAEVRRAWRRGRVDEVLEALADEQGRPRPVGPLAESADPVAARAQALDLARALGTQEASDLPEIDWHDVAEQPRLPGRTSVVVVAAEVQATRRAVESILEDVRDDLEVVVVEPGLPAHAALGLHASFHDRDGVSLLRVPQPVGAAVAADLGLVRTTGDVVVLLDAHVVVRRGWIGPLRDSLADPDVAGVQPLVLRPDDTIHSAGLLTPADEAPVHLLAGHPKEDALGLRDQALPATCGVATALRADDLVALHGWTADDPLGSRLLKTRPGGFRLVPTSLVTWHHAPDPDQREGAAPDRGDGHGLRWSLKLPSGPGRRGDLWGDTYFADALATALRDLGQDVVTRRRGAHESGPTHLDDVSVALRGLFPIPPTPGQVNVLWVISHPDDVDPAELEGYDVVCAASDAWSAELSERTGREVVPLLQATEFAPPVDAADGDRGTAEVVFVGNARADRDRPLVRKAVEAGVPLAVYGRGWEDLPDGVWRAEHVDNAELAGLYQRHGIVLADHWPDMARHGFIANRVFDALASGARVICDEVAGVNEVFDPRDVVVARTADDVAHAVDELARTVPDPTVPRPSLTFSDRAQTLLALVAAVVDQRSAAEPRP